MAEKVAGKKKQQQQQQPKQQQQQQQQQVKQQQQQQQQVKQQQQQQQQQKNKKAKQPAKNKNQENGVKHQKREWLISPKTLQNQKFQKKKKKGNENNVSVNNNINKSSKKKSVSNKRSFFWDFLTHLAYVLLILGFIYIVDYDKFVRIRDGASFYVNKTASLLPPEVLAKGKQAVEFIKPVADVTVNKVSVVAKEVSSFLNTNPLVKEHWTNIREISSICSTRLVDYIRTLYLQITGYCNDIKTKFF